MKKYRSLIIVVTILVAFLSGCDARTAGSEQESAPPSVDVAPADDNGIVGESPSPPEDVSSNEKNTMPDKSYIGTWHDDENAADILTIAEISNDTIEFELELYRLTAIVATAKNEGGKIKFSGIVEADGSAISGTLEFDVSSISVIIDESEWDYISAGYTYDFNNKAEN